jgi:hypothetical protein
LVVRVGFFGESVAAAGVLARVRFVIDVGGSRFISISSG